jgi:leucyl/phenylalanyl-tRNA--protein transferase
MLAVPWIAADDHDTPFPHVEQALDEPDGLVAIGGPLSSARLEQAYRNGIFPWFGANQPVLWWAPSTRAIIDPGGMRVARSLRKRLRRRDYTVTADHDFRAVIDACAAPRPEADGTWITPAMKEAYSALHRAGIAHSLEVWQGRKLIGGLYGVSLGAAFFGESMFSRVCDGSKIALAWLNAQLWEWDFQLIDCQMPTDHLLSLGARTTPRPTFSERLRNALDRPTQRGPWQINPELDPLIAGGVQP